MRERGRGCSSRGKYKEQRKRGRGEKRGEREGNQKEESIVENHDFVPYLSIYLNYQGKSMKPTKWGESACLHAFISVPYLFVKLTPLRELWGMAFFPLPLEDE